MTAVNLAGKLLPYLIKAGSAAKLPTILRTAGVVGGGLPQIMQGDLLGGLVGGALGGVTAGQLGGLAKGAQLAGARGVMKGIGLAGGAPLQVQGALTNLARTAVPVGLGLAAGRVGGGIGGGLGRSAVGLAGYGLTGGEGMGGAALPPGMGPFGNVSPTGNPLDVLNPVGLEAGRRTRTVKDAEALRDAQNIVLPTVRKFSEQAKKDDFERDMAAEGIKQNILMNRNLTEGLAQATRQMGTTAAEQAGSALTTRFNY